MEISLHSDPARAADRQPRYMVVANRLISEITAGRYPVDTLLPSEAALSSRFGVSRITVREALRRIEEMGLIDKVHGVGSRVVSRSLGDSFHMSVRSASDLMQYSYETVFVPARREMLPAEHPDLERIDMAGEALKLVGVRTAVSGEKAPVSYCEVYLNAAFAGVADERDRPREPYYHSMERLFGQTLVGVDQYISAIALQPHHAEVLGRQAGEPGLKVVRRFRSTGRQLLEVTINVHTAEDFSLRIHLNKS